MKRDRAQLFQSLLFQSLLSLALISFAGLGAFVLLTSGRSSPQTEETVEASGDPIVTDRAEWKQFYDAVAGSERAAEVAQPADAVPERRAVIDVADAVEVPTATGKPVDQAPSTSIPPTATTTLPVAPYSASNELAAKPDVPPAQTAATLDAPREKAVAAIPNGPDRDQVPQEAAPSVAATEKASPVLASAPIPSLDEKTEQSASTTTLPATPPLPMPRPKVAASAPPVPAARVKQAAPQPEREPQRSRASAPSRARVALPRQRSAPQSDGPQQSGAMSYAPPPNSALPPGGPQFGPYFPYGSTPPPTTQRSRAQRSRSPQQFETQSYDSRQFAPQQTAPRQPTQLYNNP